MFTNAVTTLATAALIQLAASASHAQTYTALTGAQVRALLNTLGMDPEALVNTDTGNLKVVGPDLFKSERRRSAVQNR